MTEPAEAVRAMARRAAPGLLEEALGAARAEAKQILQRQLVREILAAVDAAPVALAAPAASAPAVASVASAPAAAPVASVASAPAPAPVAPVDAHRPTPGERPPGSCYLYGVAEAGADSVTGLVGVDGSPTEAIVEDELVAVISRVDPTSPSWSVATAAEPDFESLSRLLQAHERVLEEMLDHADVLPVRFGLTFAEPADVLRMLHDGKDAIRRSLTAVRGKVEWGLTVSWDTELAGAKAAPQGTIEPHGSPHAGAGDGAGRGYLHRRRADREATLELDALRARVATSVHERLAAASCASVVLRRDAGQTLRRPDAKRSPHRSGTHRQALLKGAYLVGRQDRDVFRSVIEAQLEAGRDLGLGAELTGPWPPFHFTSLEVAPA